MVSQQKFSSVALKQGLLDNLPSLGYHDMTDIQAQTLPLIVEGKDVIGQGKTGSGKTAAFGLGLLHHLRVKRFRVQALVLCPTRELADQVAKEIRSLARGIHNIKVLTLCGGASIGPQIGSLEHGAHIIVGTPGRIEAHLRKGRLCLDELRVFVLDEADRMLDMGFQDSLDAIESYCPVPEERQTLLFSATFPDKIKRIADKIMNKPALVRVESQGSHQNIEQVFYKVDTVEQRLQALSLILLDRQPKSTVIFCTTKQDVKDVAQALRATGFNVAALHGDLEQKDRDLTLLRFANNSLSVLVATDVASRGLDIDDLDMVINYHISRDPEVHVHRIGRTGRAGKTGVACSLISDKEAYKIEQLASYLNIRIVSEPLPARSVLTKDMIKAERVTLNIGGGKQQKLRPGDILGALTANKTIAGAQIGKINIFYNQSYVAVDKDVANMALRILTEEKLKGKMFKVRKIYS